MIARVVQLAIVVLLIALAFAAVTAATGSDAATAAWAFWNASLGTRDALFSATLVRWVPLAITGVGLAIAFRAGVFNIGAEGQLLMGAVGATLVGLSWRGDNRLAGVVLGLVAATAGGAAWAAVAATLRRRFGVLEVISTLMLNFVAADLVAYLVRGPLQEPTHIYPQTRAIAAAVRLPRFGATTLHVGAALALVLGVFVWWYVKQTAGGFRLRAVGASADAAAVTGRIDIGRVGARALIASGALAGLAGGLEVTGVTYALYENLSPGYGFSAIAVAILARLDPLGALGTAFLFAVLETGALGLQRDAGLPSTLATVMEAAVILLVLAAAGVPRNAFARFRSRTMPTAFT